MKSSERWHKRRPNISQSRHIRKETWKAREAREELEAKWSQQHLDRHPPKRALSGHLLYGRVEEDGRVAEIEDVYLGEDGSIQCVVTWKLLVDA